MSLSRGHPRQVHVSRNLKADLLLIACSLIWGTTFVVVKDALADASVFVFLALRFLVASALVVAIHGRHIHGLRFSDIRAGAVIGGFMFAGYALQTIGLKLTTPSKAAFITSFCVVLVPLLLAVFGKRRIGGWMWAGVASAVTGLYLMAIPAAGFAELNLGDLLMLGCALTFALHIISIGHYTKKHTPGALSLLQVATTALATLAAVPLLTVTGWEPARVAWTPKLIVAIFVTGVLATALAFSAQTWAQRYTTASHAAIIFALEPVFAALTSYFFYYERLGWRALAGAVLILAGILLAELMGPAPTAHESA